MRVPVIEGEVERRLLINYRADADVVRSLLPAPFRPQLVDGSAVVGICLVRLGHLRPKGFPALVGLTSENAAHRIAVQWTEREVVRSGVYIRERHSAAALNVAIGDRLFPGVHKRARFAVSESENEIAVAFVAKDGACSVDASVTVCDELASGLFASMEAASAFFQQGSSGFSPRRHGRTLDGLELRTKAWAIEPAVIRSVKSSVYDDAAQFPAGSISLDSALVMRRVPVEWHGVEDIAVEPCA